MGEIINTNTAIETQPGGDTGALLDITQSLLADARTALNSSGVLSVPIAELSTLGAGVSSLIPALNTVTQTTSIAADGLYTIANAGVGDVLKAAKNGNFWASLKTAEGTSKMVQLQKAGSITATTQTAAAFNPATMMMAVALFSIEQELGKIEDMQRQIVSFLEIEKESEIEADVESLMSIIKKYKDSPSNDDPLQPGTGLVNRPSGSGEVHQKKRNGSRNNCGNSADTEDLRIHILHDRTCLRPNGIRGKSTSGKHGQHRRYHKCHIQSTTNAYISESLLQFLDDGRFVLIHTGKSSFQLEPKRKAGGLGSATQTPGLCMKKAPGRAEGRPSMKLFDAIILAFMEYRCN